MHSQRIEIYANSVNFFVKASELNKTSIATFELLRRRQTVFRFKVKQAFC